MSGTLISSLAWVPRGRAALQPKKYELDEAELERVGKLGGPGVLEQLKEQMEQMEMDDGEEWVDEEENEDEEESDDEEEKGEDEDMDEDSTKPSDPNDMSAFKMDEYDDDVEASLCKWGLEHR